MAEKLFERPWASRRAPREGSQFETTASRIPVLRRAASTGTTSEYIDHESDRRSCIPSSPKHFSDTARPSRLNLTLRTYSLQSSRSPTTTLLRSGDVRSRNPRQASSSAAATSRGVVRAPSRENARKYTSSTGGSAYRSVLPTSKKTPRIEARDIRSSTPRSIQSASCRVTRKNICLGHRFKLGSRSVGHGSAGNVSFRPFIIKMRGGGDSAPSYTSGVRRGSDLPLDDGASSPERPSQPRSLGRPKGGRRRESCEPEGAKAGGSSDAGPSSAATAFFHSSIAFAISPRRAASRASSEWVVTAKKADARADRDRQSFSRFVAALGTMS